MPLPPPDCSRKPLHNRIIRAHSFEREDGLWDIELELIDTKSYDFTKRSGWVQRAGQPFHHMHLRVTIDSDFVIVKAVASHDTVPYRDNCSAITPHYAELEGMHLLKGFRNQVKERFGRAAGCTHLTELTSVLPTVALQSMAARRRTEAEKEQERARRPFQIDGCFALRADGPVVQEFYPQWFVPSDPEMHAMVGAANDAMQ